MKRRNFKGKNNPFYGKRHTDESKRKMSLSHQGQTSWNKGETGVYSEATLSKIGLTRKMRKLKKMLYSYKCIGRQYTVGDYRKTLFLYKRVKNCREISRRLNILPQTVQNWVLHNVKPRLVKIHLKGRVM